MPPEERASPVGARTGTETSCPRCGSIDVRRLSLIHQIGLTSGPEPKGSTQRTLSRYAAPPKPKPAVMWTLLALASITIAVTTRTPAGSRAWVVGAVGAIAMLFAVRAAHFNTRVYPNLRQLWEHSYMCARCGEVFAETAKS